MLNSAPAKPHYLNVYNIAIWVFSEEDGSEGGRQGERKEGIEVGNKWRNKRKEKRRKEKKKGKGREGKEKKELFSQTLNSTKKIDQTRFGHSGNTTQLPLSNLCDFPHTHSSLWTSSPSSSRCQMVACPQRLQIQRGGIPGRIQPPCPDPNSPHCSSATRSLDSFSHTCCSPEQMGN